MKRAVSEVDKLHTLMASSVVFNRVIKSCNFLSTSGLEENEVKSVLKAGIVVTYMIPFGSGAGFRPLGNEYINFSGRDDLKALHFDLEKSRNCVYAHHGPDQAKKLLKEPSLIEEFNNIKILLKTTPTSLDGEVELETHFTVHHVGLDDLNLSKIAELCQFQKGRVEKEINLLVKQIYGDGTKYPDGEYILGRTFPEAENCRLPEHPFTL